MLHKKDDPRYKYVNVVKEGEAAGFSVRDVHYYLHDTADGRKKESISFEIDTPYLYNGKAVKAVAHVDPAILLEKEGAHTYSGGRVQGLRQYSDCELRLAESGRNLEDVSEQATGTRLYSVMKGDERVDSMQALDEIGQFAAAASNYPSVARFDEYKMMQEYHYEKMKAGELGIEPRDSDYLKYLEHQKRFSMDSHAKLIGRATTPEQIEGLINDFQMDQAMGVMNEMEDDVQYGG